MPRIPVASQSQRLNVSNPTGFQNSSAGRIEGEAIAGFGEQLMRTGDTLGRFFKAKEGTDREIEKKRVRIMASMAALEAREASKTSKPEDRLNSFVENYDKLMQEKLEGVTDAEAILESDAVKASSMTDIFNDAAKDSIALGKLKNQETFSGMINLAERNPSLKNVEALIQESDDLVEKSSAIYDPVEKEALKISNRSLIAKNSVESLKRQNKFPQAMAQVDALAKYFPKESQDDMRDSIANEAHQARARANEATGMQFMTPEEIRFNQRFKSKDFTTQLKNADDTIDRLFPKAPGKFGQFLSSDQKTTALEVKEQMTSLLKENPNMSPNDAMLKAISIVVPAGSMDIKARGISPDNKQETKQELDSAVQELKKKYLSATTQTEKAFVSEQLEVLKMRKQFLEARAMLQARKAEKEGKK